MLPNPKSITVPRDVILNLYVLENVPSYGAVVLALMQTPLADPIE